MKRGIQFPGHKKAKAGIERHPAMLRRNQTAGRVPCHNGTPKIPQTQWRCKGTGAPPPDICRQAMPPLPEMPLTPTCNSSADQPAEIVNSPAGYEYSNTAGPRAEFFTRDASAQDSQHHPDFDRDMLTDEETSTG